MNIEYLKEYNKVYDFIDSFITRSSLVKKYSWAVPSEEAITKIASYPNIIEVGAGSGYWSYLVKQAGGTITPVDIKDPTRVASKYSSSQKRKLYVFDKSWTEIKVHSHRYICNMVRDYSTLMLCWPSMEEWATKYLKSFNGDTVIYIGEGNGGCTATDSFFEELDKSWEEQNYIEIPTWDAIHDGMTVYRRK